MQTAATNRQGGQYTGLPCNQGIDIQQRKQGAPGTHHGSYGHVGAGILNSARRRTIKPKTFEYFDSKSRRACVCADLYHAAVNLCRNYRVEPPSTPPRTGEMLSSMVKELEEKIKEDITVAKFEDGSVQLLHSIQLSNDCTCYFITLNLTERLRPEVGSLLRRFACSIAKATGIPTVDEAPTFECFCEDYQYRIEDETDKEAIESLKAEYECLREITEGESGVKLTNALTDKKVTREEIKAFRPRDQYEKKLKKLMLWGCQYLDNRFCVWDYAETANEILGEALYNNTYIDARDMVFITWEEGELTDFMLQQINDIASCGAEQERFILMEPVPKKGKCRFEKAILDFFPFLSELIDALCQTGDYKIKQPDTCRPT